MSSGTEATPNARRSASWEDSRYARTIADALSTFPLISRTPTRSSSTRATRSAGESPAFLSARAVRNEVSRWLSWRSATATMPAATPRSICRACRISRATADPVRSSSASRSATRMARPRRAYRSSHRALSRSPSPAMDASHSTSWSSGSAEAAWMYVWTARRCCSAALAFPKNHATLRSRQA